VPSTGARLEDECVLELDLPLSSFVSKGRGGSPAQPGGIKAYLPVTGEEPEAPDADH
jgi:hypothetical protein